jgi:hypothetical protein
MSVLSLALNKSHDNISHGTTLNKSHGMALRKIHGMALNKTHGLALNKTHGNLKSTRAVLDFSAVSSETQQWFCLERAIISNKSHALAGTSLLNWGGIVHNISFKQAQTSSFPKLREKAAHCQLDPQVFAASSLVQLNGDLPKSFDSEKTQLVYGCLQCLRNAIPQLPGARTLPDINSPKTLSCPAKCAYVLANYYAAPVLSGMCRSLTLGSRRLKGCDGDDDDGDDDDSVGCANLKQQQASAVQAVADAESAGQHGKDFTDICPPSELSNQYSCESSTLWLETAVITP